MLPKSYPKEHDLSPSPILPIFGKFAELIVVPFNVPGEAQQNHPWERVDGRR